MDTSGETRVRITKRNRPPTRPIEPGTRPISHRESSVAPRRLLLSFGTILFLLALALCLRPVSQLENKPLTEDGYLLLSVSRHLATGRGFSADGLHPTNGFQPLFTVLASLPYLVAGGNRIAGLRGVLALDALFYVVTGCLVGLICRRMFAPGTMAFRLAAPLGAVSFLSADYVITSSFNGLETGLLLLVYALIWWYWSTHDLNSPVQQVILGLLLGAAVLARIDSIFLVASVAAHFAWQRQVRAALLATVLPIAVSAPWWIYNLALTGSLMPTSGNSEHTWALSIARVKEMFQAVTTDIVPWTYLSRFDTFPVALLRIACVILIIAACRQLPGRTTQVLRGLKCGQVESFGKIILGAAGLLIVWYTLYSHATYFYGRYLAPIMLVATVGGIWLLFGAICTRRAFIPVGIAAVLSLVAVAVFCALDVGKLFPGNSMLTQQVALVESRVPSSATVAAGQSGTLSYYRDGVINLDGKSNIDVLSRQNDIPAYLAALKVQWVCDWPAYVHRYLGVHPSIIGWHLVAAKGEFELWHHS